MNNQRLIWVQTVALRKIGSPAVPRLLKALHHPYPKVRQMVIEALSSYENANMALQELVFALQDERFFGS